MNELWVATSPYGRTAAGWGYAAFVLDVVCHLIVGWQVATNLHEPGPRCAADGDLAPPSRRART